MPDTELRMRCQRCGTAMDLRDPVPGGPWKPDQFWVCPRCGRHFWTTYPAPPKPPDSATASVAGEDGAKTGGTTPPIQA